MSLILLPNKNPPEEWDGPLIHEWLAEREDGVQTWRKYEVACWKWCLWKVGQWWTGDFDTVWTQAAVGATKNFQEWWDIPVTGHPDVTTCQKMVEVLDGIFEQETYTPTDEEFAVFLGMVARVHSETA